MPQRPSLAVDIAPGHKGRLRLSNPIMVASGTFGWDGYGSGLPAGVDIQRLGAVVAKTVTRQPRAGNPEPRWHPKSWRRAWQEGERTFINSIGLANPGIEAALREKAPAWTSWRVPVILSIAGESVAEFAEMAAMAEGVAGIAALELNLSCPNVKGGLQFGQSAEVAAEVVKRVRAATGLPVLAKLTPNVTDIVSVACAVENAGVDAIVLTNTLAAIAIDVETRKPILGGVTGGLSGPGLKPVALAMVYKVASKAHVPLIGCGGVFTYRDALEFILAGATAVQVGSANLVDFGAPLTVLDGLTGYLSEKGIPDVRELIGAAHK